MTSQFSVLLKKYSIPILLLISGLIMLFLGMSKSQGGTFMLASVMMLIAGGISVLYSSGKVKPMIVTLIGLAAGVIAIIILFI